LLLRYFAARRDDPHRDRMRMKTPTALVAAALVAAILLTASFLIATRGENPPLFDRDVSSHGHL